MLTSSHKTTNTDEYKKSSVFTTLFRPIPEIMSTIQIDCVIGMYTIFGLNGVQ